MNRAVPFYFVATGATVCGNKQGSCRLDSDNKFMNLAAIKALQPEDTGQ